MSTVPAPPDARGTQAPQLAPRAVTLGDALAPAVERAAAALRTLDAEAAAIVPPAGRRALAAVVEHLEEALLYINRAERQLRLSPDWELRTSVTGAAAVVSAVLRLVRERHVPPSCEDAP